jgi:hypothetical protein
MTGIYQRIFENGAPSWRTNSSLKVVPGLNVLPPVQKSLYFQEAPLKVSKDFNEISPSSKVRIQSTESFERPGVRIHGALDRTAGVVDDVMERSSHGLFQSVPSDRELIQHTRIDDMDIGLGRMSLPHRLVNGAGKDVVGSREI